MDPTLSPEQQQLVSAYVDGQQFHSPQEVLTVALHLFQQLEREHQHRLHEAISRGFSQMQNGEGIVLKDETELTAFFDDVKARGRQRFHARHN